MAQRSNIQGDLVALVQRLIRAEIDWDAENIIDWIWLSRYMEESVRLDPPVIHSKTILPPISSPEPLLSEATIAGTSNELPPQEPDLALAFQNTKTKSKESSARGIPFQTPTAPALRKTLAIGRALRPLMRKVDSHTQTILDEDATAEQTAEQRFCMTVMKPDQERWLEIALVIEDSASSFLWKETIRDFKQVLEHLGAFRTLNVWYLQTASNGDATLYAKSSFQKSEQQPRSPKELIDPSGRRLILLASDCISPAWRSDTFHEKYLNPWANQGPFVILQMLPSNYWQRTALNLALSVQLGAWSPGVSNEQLQIREAPIGIDSDLNKGLKIPLITLDPTYLTPWCRMLVGYGQSWAVGVWFDEGWQSLAPSEASNLSLSSEELVQRFDNTASPLAKRLAGLMAIVPVSLPIIYLLQETMLRDSTPLHLAEVFMSGLLHRVDEDFLNADGVNQVTKTKVYEFLPRVRDLLRQSVSNPAAEMALNRVSQYIGQKLRRNIYSFTALLMLAQELGESGGTDLLQFAHITKQSLKCMGGTYAALLETLEQTGRGDPSDDFKIVFQTLFPEDRGEILKRKVAEAYQSRKILQKKDANSLVIQIDAVENRIKCIYTGYSIVLEDTNRLAGTGFDQRMTFDSICPHSKRLGNFSGDMHHIFPAKATVNSARGALPFAELADAEVLEWYRDDGQYTSVPSEDKGEYSRKGAQGFEPRDLAKGIVARALFYIYTIHENQAEASFFESQKVVLRQWHRDYPPTQGELRRSQQIAESEQGNANPFVVDPTLVERIFFPEAETEWKTFQFNIATVMVLSTVEVDIAKIEIGETSNLTPFEFQIANLIEQSPSIWNRNQTYRVERTSASAMQWIEDLGNNITLEMVSIPAGRFEMGAPTTEAESQESERPQHLVEINNPFLMGKYPVTQAQWRFVAALPLQKQKLKADPSQFKGDQRPVEKVSWLDAVEFCQRLSVYTGRDYRLPSEAEWEYACRAGTTTPFHFGEFITPDLANYDGSQTYANGPKGKNRGKTTPVGSFGVANDFGLYDMHGNVREWCEDHWHGSYTSAAPKDGRAWLDNDDRSVATVKRLLRGGSWDFNPRNCRSASRSYGSARVVVGNIGFRVVCSAARTS